MFLILFVLAVVSVLYILVFRSWSYFSVRNVKFERGLPILGSWSEVVLGRKTWAEEMYRVYNKFPSDRYIGLYEMGGQPSLMIRDPELVKTISIKDFDSFVNPILCLDATIDPLLGRSVFMARDQLWRDLRSVMTPLFTGSKMRTMLTLMTDSIDEFTSHIRQEITETNPKGGAIEYRMIDLFCATTNDVIASCVFGIQTNTLKDKDNEFYEIGTELAQILSSKKLRFAWTMPKLAKVLKLKMLDKRFDDFFRNIVRKNVQQRKEQNIVRNDMINLLLLAQNGKLDLKEKEELADAGFATVSEVISARSAEKLRELTEDDFVSQLLVFFLAGFLSTASTMSFLSYELALDPDIQDRLRHEIVETHNELGGNSVTYEVLQKMKYLDQVISEVLRKWPPGFLLDRRVSKQYTLENTDGSKTVLQPDDFVWLPVYAIHHDEKFYPNPEKFDPERFSTENRRFINSATYFPFGYGPRACVATRFALMELKSTIFYVLLNFYIEVSQNTVVPLKFKPGSFSLAPEQDIKLQFRLRN